MGVLHKIKQFFRLFYDKDFRFLFFCEYGVYNWMDDQSFLKRKYKTKFNRELNLENPQAYNEKLQWLKLYNRKNEYTRMVDKYAAKEYVASIIGGEYIIPTLGVWDSFNEIDFEQLPEQFVLKCTHDSGGLVICKNKKQLDINAAKKKINKSLKRNFYLLNREWPYKNVKPRIIAEKYMEDSNDGKKTGELKDYKFYCFDGKVQFMMIAFDRFSSEKTKLVYYDRNYNRLNFFWGHEIGSEDIKKTEKFEDMVILAERLSKDIPHVRVDFYIVDNQVYFGELTLFDGGGFDIIKPFEKDLEFGQYLTLPPKTIQ